MHRREDEVGDLNQCLSVGPFQMLQVRGYCFLSLIVDSLSSPPLPLGFNLLETLKQKGGRDDDTQVE